MKKAGVRLLEPIMKVEVVTPEDHMGDVIGDLNSRRGLVQEFTDKPGGMKARRQQGVGGRGAAVRRLLRSPRGLAAARCAEAEACLAWPPGGGWAQYRT